MLVRGWYRFFKKHWQCVQRHKSGNNNNFVGSRGNHESSGHATLQADDSYILSFTSKDNMGQVKRDMREGLGVGVWRRRRRRRGPKKKKKNSLAGIHIWDELVNKLYIGCDH